MSHEAEQFRVRLLLVAFIFLGFTYAIMTPPFEASDELWHYPMIQHLGNGNPLPVQVTDPALAGPWKQEASQPPLYYYVGAALTFWIDTSDMERVRWLNPHVDNGVITPDGNINLAVHDPDFKPWQGTLLAIRIVRLVSVLMGAATVYLTFLIAKEIVPTRPELAIGAAALTGFTPMFLFISGAVNNDNLAIPLASLGMLLLIRLINRPLNAAHPDFSTGSGAFQIVWIGSVIGAAVLTKQGTIGLLPLSWGTFFIYEWIKHSEIEVSTWPGTFQRIGRALVNSLLNFALMMIPVTLIAGWWYWRNIVLYGDLLGWSAFIAVLGERETAAPIAQLWDERWGFMLSYWGLFGGVNVPMWEWSYRVLNAILVLSIPGGIYFVARPWFNTPHPKFAKGDRPTWIAVIPNRVAQNFGLTVVLLFSIAIVYGLIQWATTTWSSQGRLVFTAISAMNILWVFGIGGWLPSSISKWVVTSIVTFLGFLALISPALFIRPSYQPAAQNETCAPETAEIDERTVFSDTIRFVDSGAYPESIRPGEQLPVQLQWEMIETTDRDWSVFVHLNDPVLGVPIAQRDMYFEQGLRPTSILETGFCDTNTYVLTVPETAVAPAELILTVGLYEFESGERLVLPDGSDHLDIGTIRLEAAEGETPNPVSVNFGGEFELVGYELDPRRVKAGETIDATFYWKALRIPEEDATFFTQIVGNDTTRYAAVDLGQSVTTWTPGEVVPLTISLNIDPEAPAGVYPVRLGIYRRTEDGGFNNLQRVTAEGRLTDDFINLTVIRIDD